MKLKIRSSELFFRLLLYLGIVFLFLIIIGVLFFFINNGLLEILKEQKADISFLQNIFLDLKSAIVGTSLLVLISVSIATPIGLLTGIYISEYLEGKKKTLAQFMVKILSGIPSIIVGIFGFLLLIICNNLFNLDLRTGFIVSVLSIGSLILPYIINSTIQAFSDCDPDLRKAGLSLGAKKYQLIFRILIPESFLAIFSGFILSIGRAAEDTAVIMLTGVSAFSALPKRIFDSYEALPFYIYYYSSEYQNEKELLSVYVASFIMIAFTSSIIIIASIINKKIHYHLKYRK